MRDSSSIRFHTFVMHAPPCIYFTFTLYRLPKPRTLSGSHNVPLPAPSDRGAFVVRATRPAYYQ